MYLFKHRYTAILMLFVSYVDFFSEEKLLCYRIITKLGLLFSRRFTS